MRTVLVSGLTWLEEFSEPMQYKDTAEYVKKIGDGFRLPTINELTSLVSKRHKDPSIDLSIFPGCPSGIFWSSTAWEKDPNYKWTVSFYDGCSFGHPLDMMNRVRLVKTI